ncbi:MAG: alanine--tRNA ligase [Clostridia bacterium]|nr:alanine--tRNA ligase [Clostridia bacterium]
MNKITSKELRSNWINFYKERGHVDCGAVSLVSDGSTGAMFNVAGMQPIMPYLLGKKHPLGTRLCNVQGCVRTNDIDGVGDKSHLTFFEMMGSWSLGDYFKKERCQWSYELLTEVFGFDRDHLAATVFEGDENAPRDEEGAQYRIESGFKKENVFFLPAEDNWWGLEYGPCGPDSEMFYVSEKEPCGPDCRPGCHCGKYTEIGNDVFMQYDKQQDGTLLPLAKKNVDTGWGLERNLAFLNGVDDVYKTDLFTSAISYMEKASGMKYGDDEKSTKSMRIIADHLRTGVMLIGDEAKLLPSNGGPGYVLRRLLRRAVRHGRALNLSEQDLLNVASTYIDDVYAESYPLLKENKDFIFDELKKEIDRFELTLENGMKEFRKIADSLKNEKAKTIDGKSAFYLYDTFGFPYELTLEMAEEEGLEVDEAGFKSSMEEQKQRARENSNFSQKTASADVFESLDAKITSTFVGYEKLEAEDTILAMADSEKITDTLNAGDEGTIIVGTTPFYATMGGQKGDNGIIETAKGKFEVIDTVKIPGGRIGHIGKVTEGIFKVSDKVKLSVDKETRTSTCKNHTATHLLQKSLQEVLGDHVEQAGSDVNSDRLRFDFTHDKAVTKDELKKVEEILNDAIMKGMDVVTKEMPIEEAKKLGAMMLFGEKYGDTVRVVNAGDWSIEFCGGTHIDNTGKIGLCKITSESSVASGVRRIEAVTGKKALEFYNSALNQVEEIASSLKCKNDEASQKVKDLIAKQKETEKEIAKAKSANIAGELDEIIAAKKDVNGITVISKVFKGLEIKDMQDLSDRIKDKVASCAILFGSDNGDAASLVAAVTEDVIAKGVKAGDLVKEMAPVIDGKGGGRPNMAQAGGKNPKDLEKALEKGCDIIKNI